MKIAIVVPYFSGFGSNESELAEAFTKQGHNVTVFTTNVKSGSRLADINYSKKSNYDVINLDVFINIKGLPIVYNFENKIKGFDLILAQEDYQFMSYQAYKYAKKNKIPFIISNERYKMPAFPKSILLKIIEALYSNNIRKHSIITTHSESARDYLYNCGIKKEILIIPTPIDTNKFFPKKKNLFREKYSIKNTDVVLFSIGRLVPYKNYEKLIEEFKKLPDNYKLIILGKGYLNERLKKLIDYNKNIILINEFVNPEYIVDYINSCDIYIQPSINEPFGIVVREAMACGKPIIVTPEGGLKDAIDGNGEFLNFNMDNLKQAINNCIKNKKMYSTNSLELAKKGDVSTITNKYLSLIKNKK